ncbi:MAG: FAD-dependent monooxygenase, partial [Rhodobacteraceae bacterium]|nr:FAD-dependent monooxygenase [Paracoccaceae bacterium]
FQCCGMASYRHGRVFFAGDSAHLVSPFGARGCNGGIQDAENLAWKLALVTDGVADDALLDSYDVERRLAASENIMNSTRSTDFMTPKSAISRMFRESVLDLVEHVPFARALVNSGRLSVPAIYDGSPLSSGDESSLPSRTRPGAPVVDAPTDQGWMTDVLNGRLQLLAFNCDVPEVCTRQVAKSKGIDLVITRLDCARGTLLAERYVGDADQAVYLFRPDQHVAARWINASTEEIIAALEVVLSASHAEGPRDAIVRSAIGS